MYLETSAVSGDGVEETFLRATRSILTRIETGAIDPESMGAGIQYGNSTIERFEESTLTNSKKCC